MDHLTKVMIFILQLSLSCCPLSADSPCSVEGTHVYETGDQLDLTCDGGDDHKIKWKLPNGKVEPGRTLTMSSITLDDSGVYNCRCRGGEEEFNYYVLVFKASLHVSVNKICRVAIVLTVTAPTSLFSLTSFSCPTLNQGNYNSWNFPGITHHENKSTAYIFATGDWGEKNHTCNFTVVYNPNGATYSENFSKSVHLQEKTECSRPTTDAITSVTPMGLHGSCSLHHDRRLIAVTIVALASIIYLLE